MIQSKYVVPLDVHGQLSDYHGMETPIKHVRMPDEMWDALVRMGKEPDIDRTPGWLIRKAVEEYIERHLAAKRAAKASAKQA